MITQQMVDADCQKKVIAACRRKGVLWLLFECHPAPEHDGSYLVRYDGVNNLGTYYAHCKNCAITAALSGDERHRRHRPPPRDPAGDEEWDDHYGWSSRGHW